MKNGFTIIEVLIAVTISAVIGLILTQLLSQSLQGGNKSDLLNNIQHNGESALTKIETDIRSGYNVTCVTSNVLVIAEGDNYHRYWFVAPVGGVTPANGYIEMDTISSLTDPQLINDYACKDATDPNYVAGDSGSAQDITDTDLNNGVSVSGGSFSRVGSASNLVNISFNIVAPVNAAAGFASQVPSAGIPFQTSVKVRCYKGDLTCE